MTRFRLPLVVVLFLFVCAAARGEIVQKGHLRVSVTGKFAPRSLPRNGAAPISIEIGGRISTTDGKPPPQLRRVTIEINHNGHLNMAALPSCRLDQIQPGTSRGALESCRRSLVGEGNFSANVQLPQQAPFPSRGKVLVFAGAEGGKPVLLAHVYGTDPVPTSYTLPFVMKSAHGTFGTALTASLPQVTSNWGFVTGLELKLGRQFGRKTSFLSAGCHAPTGFPGVVFPLVRTSFAFAHGPMLSSVLNRACKARR